MNKYYIVSDTFYVVSLFSSIRDTLRPPIGPNVLPLINQSVIKTFKANSSANWNAGSHQIWRGCHTCVDSGDLNQALPTISSVFHLHNTSATRELSVYLDGLRLRHECHPTYLGVTLDHTDLCPCGETQTMSHIVKSYPLTKVNGGLSRLHTADEDAVLWLTSYGS